MCGISLVLLKSGNHDGGENAIRAMISAQKHRGPDGSGFQFLDWEEDKIWVGHNLLAISDQLENSKQPFVSEDATCGIAFNGEIYNHAELRNELLALGQTFRTNSDTETLLYWLRHFGRKGLRRLTGMFAFVYWDSKRRILIIHRDGIGIKPLYYARNRNSMVFASEPKALFASNLFSFSIDPTAVSSFLKYKFTPSGSSPWLGIRQLLPGEVIEFWESKPMHYQVHKEAAKERVADLEEAMDRAFSETIPTDRPVGLMLSGGIDSSLIFEWCHRNKLPVTLFSIRFTFTHDLVEDQKAVEKIASLFGVPVHWIEFGMEDFSDLLSFPQKGELLVADTAWILTRKIAKEARRLGIKVLLSGAGADEWFAGYRRHWFFYQWLKYSKLFPDKLKKVALEKLKIGKLRWIEMPEGGSISDVWDAAVSSKFAGVLKQKIRIPLPSLPEPDSDLDRVLAWDQRNYLCQDVLAITDLATMEYGIEGRFPFLHPALCNFAGSMSAKDRIHHGRKWLLKQKVEAWAGKEFTKRKKQGFGLPLDLFFTSDTGKEWVSKSREILVARLPELFKDKEWFDFQKEADLHPGNFSQENLALGWLADWLKTND